MREVNLFCLCNYFYKSREQRLNLSGSWHKGHSRAYNTLFHLSRIQRICLSRCLNLFSGIASATSCRRTECRHLCYGLGQLRRTAYASSLFHLGKLSISPLSSVDSGLEAFSRHPTHGSFSALTFQSTELTNYVTQRFLSY